MEDPEVPLVIMALRSGSRSVNISLKSGDLAPVWARLRPDQALPERFAQLAEITDRVVLDVTALEQNLPELRLWAYAWNFKDQALRASLWPCGDLDFENRDLAVGMGVYAQSTAYKYYYKNSSGTRLIKGTWNQGQRVSTQEEQLVDQLTEQQQQDLGLKDLGLDWSNTQAQERVDGTAIYVTIWS